ncbi:MAG: T9SS type A sorting domain-containing protein [Saprospiraceae bacterium]|nr:T9SS type A sorting domain-containing protein [Saprospiraceae bacterium]
MKKTALFLALFLCTALSAQNIVTTTLLGTKSQSQLLSQFGIPFIQYGVKYYRITYTTTNVQNALDTVSGLLVVPNNPNKVFPRLVYQHGTSGSKLDVPSYTVSNGEGQVGLLFGGMGYVALLPDYLGLGVSDGFHPYVHAASEASVAVDMLRAETAFEAQNPVLTNDQLFITGYSQGGHAAMALHRKIELEHADEFTVTAAAPLSGPYSISGVMRNLILTDAVYYYPAYIPNTLLSYQTVYGNIFSQMTDVFKPVYANLITPFFNGTKSLNTLNTQLITALTTNEGACRPYKLFQDSAVALIQNDLNHPLNIALRDNDTYNNWTPQAPMRLFYCKADDQVPFMNSVVARDTLSAVGAPDFLASDVDSTADHGDCFDPAMTNTVLFFLGFQQIGTVSADDPSELNRLEMAPNPAREVLTFKNLPKEGTLEILDYQGKIMLSSHVQAGNAVIRLTDLPNGIYIAKYSAAGIVRTEKVVIQK